HVEHALFECRRARRLRLDGLGAAAGGRQEGGGDGQKRESRHDLGGSSSRSDSMLLGDADKRDRWGVEGNRRWLAAPTAARACRQGSCYSGGGGRIRWHEGPWRWPAAWPCLPLSPPRPRTVRSGASGTPSAAPSRRKRTP